MFTLNLDNQAIALFSLDRKEIQSGFLNFSGIILEDHKKIGEGSRSVSFYWDGGS